MEFLRSIDVTVRGSTVFCPVFSLVDRRSLRPRTKEWMLCKSAELILFGPNSVRVCRERTTREPAKVAI
jgi:hypothetical protein